MASSAPRRRLAAILAADMDGYSQLMERDEAGTVARLKSDREEFIDPTIAAHGGRIVRLAGDGALVEFPSVVEATQCAVDIQRGMPARNAVRTEDQHIIFRMGVNLGDILVEDDNLHGEGINVAARLESLAEPGGILVSEEVARQVEGKVSAPLTFVTERTVKNIERPVRIWRVDVNVSEATGRPPTGHPARRRRLGLFLPLSLAIIALVGALAWYRPSTPDVDPAVLARMAYPLPDKPSIAVLPFDNMSNDAGQEYFVDGMTEDLITDLSKLSGLFVIARNSVFTYKGRPVDVQQVAEELGVRYVLEGSVRRVDDKVRINAQLLDATTGGHLWAERYDGELDDVFELQDEITSKILSALQVKLTNVEYHAMAQRYTKQLDAYDSLLKGLAIGGPRSRATNLEARAYFEDAIALDPRFARAYANVANTHRIEYRNGWGAIPEQSIANAYDFANKAIELNESIPQVHFVMALVHREAREHAKAVAAAQRAIELDPNYADALVALASILCYGGRADEGLELMRRGIRMNPHHPSNYPFHLGQCYFALARYDEAIEAFEGGIERAPDTQRMHIWLAASYLRAGRSEDAAWEVDNILIQNPEFSVEGLRRVVPFKDPKVLELFIADLRTAGLPE